MLTDMKENGVDPVRRCLSFAAGLALNQHAPQVALEILSNSRNSNYVSIRNLKLWSLADLNRPDDCLPILRFSIEFDAGTENKRHSVLSEIVSKLSKSVFFLLDYAFMFILLLFMCSWTRCRHRLSDSEIKKCRWNSTESKKHSLMETRFRSRYWYLIFDIQNALGLSFEHFQVQLWKSSNLFFCVVDNFWLAGGWNWSYAIGTGAKPRISANGDGQKLPHRTAHWLQASAKPALRGWRLSPAVEERRLLTCIIYRLIDTIFTTDGP